MRKFFKFFAVFLLVLFIVAAAGIMYYNSNYPDVEPPKDLTFEYTPELISRGEYLARNVSMCIDCHSTRDWTLYSGPLKPGTEGMGGEKYGEELGIPGSVYSKNITPAGLSSWTDGEIFRAITSGVNKHGDVLFPIMPYTLYNQMAEEDVKAIIAYIRQLKPIQNEVAASSINFPVNMLMKSGTNVNYTPESRFRIKAILLSTGGIWLPLAAACADCHSPAERRCAGSRDGITAGGV
jgi:mono/diheme cytochrome c family protein